MMIATFWQQMPFVRLLIPLMIGIIIGDSFQLNLLQLYILLAATAILNYTVYLFVKSFRFEPSHGMMHTFLCFLIGLCLISTDKQSKLHNHFSAQKTDWLLVQTETKPKQLNKRISFETRVIAGQNNNDSIFQLHGKLQLNLPFDSLSLQLKLGDQILIKSNYQEISLPKNPGEFNYKSFMARKGIFHQQFLFHPEWKLFAFTPSFSLQAKVDQWQSAISTILANYLNSEEEIGISEALLFGLDDHIPDELIQAYSRTGTLHVLAVSGMHVGLIFIILGWLFKPIKKKKWGRITEPYFLLIGIWTYALLCGMSPSILRAAIMFSFMVVGKIIYRSGNPFNSLATSCFFLLCWQPQLLWHAGFQLSYAAVLGIICFYPPLYQAVYIGNNLLNEIYKVIAVSLAAQLLTFPISLFYFHQFPNYFLLANLLLIPLTTLLIYLGILLLMVHKIALLASGLAWVISKMISLTNFLVTYLSNLPFAAIEQIYFPFIYALFSYSIIIAVSTFLFYKTAYPFKLVLLLLVFGFGLNQMHQFLKNREAEITIYAVPKKTIISYVEPTHGWVWSNVDTLKTKKIIQQHFVKEGIKLTSINYLDSGSFMIQMPNELCLLWVNKKLVKWPSKIDILIIGGKTQLITDSLINCLSVKQIVLQQGISFYQREAIQKLCGKNKLACHDIASQGAYLIKETTWKHW
jgi:competence protein ComEC